MAQQKTGELLTGLPQAAHGGQPGPDQIAHRLMGKVGYPHGRQCASPMQTRQIDRIPPVGLDPVPGLAGDQRRSHHHAVMPRSSQLPLDAVAARLHPATPRHWTRPCAVRIGGSPAVSQIMNGSICAAQGVVRRVARRSSAQPSRAQRAAPETAKKVIIFKVNWPGLGGCGMSGGERLVCASLRIVQPSVQTCVLNYSAEGEPWGVTHFAPSAPCCAR